MKFSGIMASLLALASSVAAQHVHFDIPEVEHFVESMLNQFDQ